jgi:hypothetical protein
MPWQMTVENKPQVPAELEIIFDSVWEVIQPRGTVGPKAEQQLRMALARRLIILINNGVVDAPELRRRAIEHFVLRP